VEKMSVKEYSMSRDGNLQLAPNFRVREFRSRCGADEVLIDSRLVERLQKIRDHFGKPVNITSAYRSPAHNTAVGGARNSQHVLGTAADITISGVTPMEICQFAEWLMPTSGGIGLYNGFAHVDVRANRARWDQRSGREVAVSGFPGFVPKIEKPATAVVEQIETVVSPHWAKKHLDSLVKKEVVEDAESWTDFDEPATKGQVLALGDKLLEFAYEMMIAHVNGELHDEE